MTPRLMRALMLFTNSGSSGMSSRGSRAFTSQNLALTARNSTETVSPPASPRPAPKPVMERIKECPPETGQVVPEDAPCQEDAPRRPAAASRRQGPPPLRNVDLDAPSAIRHRRETLR